LPLYLSLRVHLESEFSLDLVHSVAAGSVDFAIVAEVPVPQSLTSSALIEAPLHAVLNEDDPTAKEESVSIRELADKS